MKLDSLSSQTKCNTRLRCCHGTQIRTALIGRADPDCPSSSQGLSIRQIAASLDRAPSTISRELKRNRAATKPYKPIVAEERTAARRWKGSRWSVMRRCGTKFSPGSAQDGRPSRWPAAWRWRAASLASAMRASTASSMPRSPAPMTAAGATTCPAQSSSAADAAGRAAAPSTSSQAACPSRNGRPPPAIATPRPLGSRPHAVRQIWPGHPYPA